MNFLKSFKKLEDIYIESYSLNSDKNKDFFDCVGDLLYTPEVQSLKQYPQHDKMDRLQHITSVAYMSYRISRRLRLDYIRAARAATLHDLFYYDWHESDWSHRFHGFRHPKFAAVNAKTLCGDELDKRMEKMILRHMWPLTPLPPSSLEGFVLTMSDKYCASKEMQYIKKARKGKSVPIPYDAAAN